MRAGGGTRTHDLTMTRERKGVSARVWPWRRVHCSLVRRAVWPDGGYSVRPAKTAGDAIVGTRVGTRPGTGGRGGGDGDAAFAGDLAAKPAAVTSLAEFGENLTVVDSAKL